jgi:hypothetical protein
VRAILPWFASGWLEVPGNSSTYSSGGPRIVNPAGVYDAQTVRNLTRIEDQLNEKSIDDYSLDINVVALQGRWCIVLTVQAILDIRH